MDDRIKKDMISAAECGPQTSTKEEDGKVSHRTQLVSNYTTETSEHGIAGDGDLAARRTSFEAEFGLPTELPTVEFNRQATRRSVDTVPGAYPISPHSTAAEYPLAINDPPADMPRAPENEAANERDRAAEESVIDGAVLVQDDIEQAEGNSSENREDVIEGEVISSTENQEKRPSKRWPWVVFAVVGTGIVLFLVLFFSLGESTGDSNTSSATNAPQSMIYPAFQEDLPPPAIKEITSVGSPLYFANKWMIEDPYIKSYSEQRKRQRFLMATLYYTTRGEEWLRSDGWLDYDISECDWFSSTSVDELEGKPRCDDEGNLLILSLASNNLQGFAPDLTTFQRLPFAPKLYAFDIANNNVTGVVPNLQGTAELEITVISNNSFTSFGPGGAVSSARTRILKGDSNPIRFTTSDSVANWFRLFPNLELYNFTDTLMDGRISPGFHHCKKLTYIGVGHGMFRGGIPSQFGLLPNLRELDVSGNSYMEGPIPSQLGMLSKLAYLDIEGTPFTGVVPPELCSNEGGTFHVNSNCSLIECCPAS